MKLSLILKNYCNVRDLMKMYGKTYHQVVYALSTGRIKATKFNWEWAIYKGDLPDEWPVRKRYRGG